MTKLRLPSTTARSCRRAPRSRSAVTGGFRLVDEALVAEVEVRELPVGVFEAGQRDRGSGRGGGTAHLGDAVLEAMRQVDAHTMLGTSHWVADRLADRLDDAGYPKPAAPCLDVDLVFDRAEERLQLVRRHRRINPPHRRHLVGLFTAHDLDQR